MIMKVCNIQKGIVSMFFMNLIIFLQSCIFLNSSTVG